MSRDSKTDINCRITQYKNTISIQDIGIIQFLKNGVSKTFKLFTSRIKIIN